MCILLHIIIQLYFFSQINYVTRFAVARRHNEKRDKFNNLLLETLIVSALNIKRRLFRSFVCYYSNFATVWVQR